MAVGHVTSAAAPVSDTDSSERDECAEDSDLLVAGVTLHQLIKDHFSELFADHKVNLFTYRGSCSGRKLVDWVLAQSTTPRTRQQVIQMWQALLAEGVLQHGEPFSLSLSTPPPPPPLSVCVCFSKCSLFCSAQRAPVSRRAQPVLPVCRAAGASGPARNEAVVLIGTQPWGWDADQRPASLHVLRGLQPPQLPLLCLLHLGRVL